MLRELIEACLSSNWIGTVMIAKDIAIALAYFAIPAAMLWVMRDREEDLLYPWLWVLFVAFIVACGMTHVAHAWSLVTGLEYLYVHLVLGVVTALVSVGTAVAFVHILPEISKLPSPSRQKAELEKLVEQRTREKDALIKEINHRIGNQLQIISSLVSIEMRNAGHPETLDTLARLRAEVDRLNNQHLNASQQDYSEEIRSRLIERGPNAAAAAGT